MTLCVCECVCAWKFFWESPRDDTIDDVDDNFTLQIYSHTVCEQTIWWWRWHLLLRCNVLYYYEIDPWTFCFYDAFTNAQFVSLPVWKPGKLKKKIHLLCEKDRTALAQVYQLMSNMDGTYPFSKKSMLHSGIYSFLRHEFGPEQSV